MPEDLPPKLQALPSTSLARSAQPDQPEQSHSSTHHDPVADWEEADPFGSQTALMDYQDAMLEILSSGLPQDAILEAMATELRFASYRDYIASFDPDMVAVACELMGKWAKRKTKE